MLKFVVIRVRVPTLGRVLKIKIRWFLVVVVLIIHD